VYRSLEESVDKLMEESVDQAAEKATGGGGG
jgi:hypothetical protein